MLSDFTIGVFELIRLVRQLVHIVQQRVVLFFCLDETCDNFINGSDACRLFDLLESVFDDLYVAQILVQESFLLSVGGHDFSKTELQDSKWVLELAVLRLVFRRCLRLVIFNLVLFLLFVKFLLVPLDLRLEVVLVFFMLRPERDGLINLLLAQTLAEDSRTVFLLSLPVHLASQVLQSLRLTVLVHDLAAQHVDLALQLLVL